MQTVLHMRSHLRGDEGEGQGEGAGEGASGASAATAAQDPARLAHLACLDGVLPLQSFQDDGSTAPLRWAQYVDGPAVLPRLPYAEDVLAAGDNGSLVEAFVGSPALDHALLAPLTALMGRLQEPSLWGDDGALRHLLAQVVA